MDPLFIFKKAVTPFLLPPGVFAVLLMVIGAVTLFRRHWRIGLLNMILGAALWALSTAPVAGGLMRGLEAPFTIPETITKLHTIELTFDVQNTMSFGEGGDEPPGETFTDGVLDLGPTYQVTPSVTEVYGDQGLHPMLPTITASVTEQ